jgi:hypothetical protein
MVEQKRKEGRNNKRINSETLLKIRSYGILLILRVSTLAASYPRLKNQDTVKPYERPTAKALG